MPDDAAAFEKHYCVGELARIWGLGSETERLRVKDEPRLIKIKAGSKKPHTTYSAPESAARRIHTRLLNARHSEPNIVAAYSEVTLLRKLQIQHDPGGVIQKFIPIHEDDVASLPASSCVTSQVRAGRAILPSEIKNSLKKSLTAFSIVIRA